MTIVWSVVIALGLLIEIFTFELVSIWFSAGAIVALILQISGVELVWQLVAFFAISIVCIACTRPLFKRILAKSEGHTNLDVIVGEQYKVIKAITKEENGTIKINGVIWNAEEINGEECAENALVEVVEFKGTTVKVKKIEAPNVEIEDPIVKEEIKED